MVMVKNFTYDSEIVSFIAYVSKHGLVNGNVLPLSHNVYAIAVESVLWESGFYELRIFDKSGSVIGQMCFNVFRTFELTEG